MKQPDFFSTTPEERIIANRHTRDIRYISDKVYSRHLFDINS
jgi:hypothetical protein